MILFSGLFLLIVGGFGGYQLATIPKIKEMKRNSAIQERFEVQANEFTIVLENSVEQTYILATKDQEYRIKFSDNAPVKVVFCEALETVG